MNITGPKILFTIPIFGGINITQTVLTSCVAALILCLSAVLLGRNLKKRPGPAQVLTEKGVTMIYGLVEEAMGKHNSSWAPYISALFLSSILGSLLGMTGILRSSTGDLSTTATWAVMTSLICWYQNIKNFGLKAWLKSFTEPIAVMTPMNVVSELAQPVSLAFRHFGNIAGGGVITAMLYWALSGASAALLQAASASGLAAALILLAAGIVLFFAVKPKPGKKGLLWKILGAVTGMLGLLSLISYLSGLIRLPDPGFSDGTRTLLYFAGLLVILAGVAVLLFMRSKARYPLGILILLTGIAGLTVILGGAESVPFLTLGIPAVLSLYFDVFAGLIQAFVFSLLSMIYISGACPPPEERIQRGKNRQKTAAGDDKETNNQS